MDEKLIAERFKKAIKSYDTYAIVQKQMAKKIFENLINIAGNEYKKILEFGCGTGFVTNQIINNIKFNELVLNDIVEDYCFLHKNKSDKIKIKAGNIENIIEHFHNFDLIISNATIQWVENKKQLFDKFFDILSDNGLIAITTFGNENYKEIKNTFGVGLEYLSKDDYLNMLRNRFDILYEFEEKVTLKFNNIFDVLKHIKFTGVNGIIKLSLNKEKLNLYSKKYLENNSINSYILTYNPIYFVGRKK
ncbi:MAG TPA: malonyl-ACP O-methyltransferase BioC [Ignavibacteriales bacterium]|nr:malonyl-ACP O-methyltransferase BioC [Ignavibacteriales bacterium]HOL82363.1 malonyl-ACP O-methyltransferase BioC [Ignavibacteriales bacterium]HOM66425.1 malonyl-ACP O-methyltransferase BioC [Ignavibacteriales bacterium]HRR19747.1 malonyl-ACP O-methyltransferase BioC [Ignavibacteriales bacterium]HRU00042.1 malonyl-ACP O-methyltransferase BioC [Ignavibacteriales bacterium]